MRNVLIVMLVGLASFCFAQTKIITTDSTGNLYVVLIRPDSVAVVYQGKTGAYTTTNDGLFMKDFSAFDVELKGFFRAEKLKSSLSELNNKSVKTKPVENDVIVTDPTPVVEKNTEIFLDKVGFGNKLYSIEPEKYATLKNTPTQIKGMRGYDFSPIVMDKNGDVIQKWKQSYVAIKGDRDVWHDGNATYYLKPKGYYTDLSYNLMDFDIRFPAFELPKNKYVIVQATPDRENGVYNYLKHGVSYVKGKNDGDGFTFVSDNWLYNLGCPAAYVSSQEAFDKWCSEVDGDKLLQSFIHQVYFPCKDLGYVMLNWEAVSWRWNVRRDKIIKCLEYWKNHEHKAKMSLWMVSRMKIPRPWFVDWGVDYSRFLDYKGDVYAKEFRDFVHVYDEYSKYVEIGHIGGYQNYPSDDGLIHHYLSEFILNKKHSDNILLASVWHDVEPLKKFALDFVKVESDAGTYFSETKPRVTPATAFNWGAWTVAVGHGIDCWSDPYYWTDNKKNWGTNAFNSSNVRLNPQFGNNLSKYSAQPLKNIDWLMSGVWAVSENKDIIDAATDWNWVDLPSKSYFEKKVLIAYKLGADNKNALVLCLDNFGAVDAEKEHFLKINGKDYKVKTYGRFTSVIRLWL